MFGAYKFRDVFSEINSGIPPFGYAAGSFGGSVVQMSPFDKMLIRLICGSASPDGQIKMWLNVGSVSTTVTSQFAGTSLTTCSIAANSLGFVQVMEIRGEFLTNYNSGWQWIQPVISISAGSVNCAVDILGFVQDYGPASYYDNPSTYVNQEIDYF